MMKDNFEGKSKSLKDPQTSKPGVNCCLFCCAAEQAAKATISGIHHAADEFLRKVHETTLGMVREAR